MLKTMFNLKKVVITDSSEEGISITTEASIVGMNILKSKKTLDDFFIFEGVKKADPEIDLPEHVIVRKFVQQDLIDISEGKVECFLPTKQDGKLKLTFNNFGSSKPILFLMSKKTEEPD